MGLSRIPLLTAPAVRVRGVVLNGLLDYTASACGADDARDAAADAGLTTADGRAYPDVWYDKAAFDTLLETCARAQGRDLAEVAREAGRHVAPGTLAAVEDVLAYVAVDHLIERMERFFRLGDAPPVRLHVDGPHRVTVRQVLPEGPVTCALFHGMLEGLLSHLEDTGRLADGAVADVECRAAGDHRCAYHLAWRDAADA